MTGLAPKQYFFLDGGWHSDKAQGRIFHIVERMTQDTYAFVICNKGEGVFFVFPLFRIFGVAFWITRKNLQLQRVSHQFSRWDSCWGIV